jgi:hypothetical protein
MYMSLLSLATGVLGVAALGLTPPPSRGLDPFLSLTLTAALRK